MNEFDYLAKAKNKMNDEKYREVISLCNKALKINDNLPKAYDFRATAKYELGEYEEAVSDYSEVIKREPDDVDHYYNRSWAYYKMEKYEEAILDINEVLKIEPNNSFYYFEKAKFEYCIQRYKESIADCTISIKSDPTEEKYVCRGTCYTKLDEYELALADFNSALEINPEYDFAYYRRGILYQNLDNIEKAEKDFKKAIKLDPEDDEAMVELGSLQIEAGKANAIKYFNKAVKINPSEENYYCRIIARSDILKRQDAIEKLAKGEFVKDYGDDIPIFNEKQALDDLKDLSKILALDSNTATALCFRVRRYNYLKQYENVLKDCEALLELEPENKNRYSAMGYCKCNLGQYKEALEYFDTYLKMNKGSGDDFLYFKKGCANYKLQNFQNALNDFTKSLALEEASETFYYRALTNYKLKHFIQSYKDYKKALELNSEIENKAETKIPKIIKLFLNKKRNNQMIGLNSLKKNN